MNARNKLTVPAVLTAFIVYLLAGTMPAWAMNCQDYANQAVQDYHIAESHPGCHVGKSLRWQDNYMNHYNGCLFMSDALLESEEAARQGHLHDCGEL